MASDRIIKGRPLSTIWDYTGTDLPNTRIEDIGREEADRMIMGATPPQVIIAQVGAPMLWIRASVDDLRKFWKRTPRSAYYNTANNHDEVLDKRIKPSFMLYASRWGPHGDSELLLLEMVCWPSAVSIAPD